MQHWREPRLRKSEHQPLVGRRFGFLPTKPWFGYRSHARHYEWTCAGNKAVISKQIETVDPRGFITDNWKQKN
jgi:hypothetical protein